MPLAPTLTRNSMPPVMQPDWVGRRVVVRRTVGSTVSAGGTGRTGATHTDVLGELIYLDEERIVIDSAHGQVEVARDSIALTKLVEASTRAQLELERIANDGWRAATTEWAGGWLLRADHGFTRRANSALPLRAPGRPMMDMVAAVVDWYAARGLQPRIHVPEPARKLLAGFLADTPFRQPGEGPEVGSWRPGPVIDVMAGRLDLMLAQHRPDVDIASMPGPDWLAVARDGSTPPAGVALMGRHDRVGFLTLRAGRSVLAVVRGVVDDGWLGVSALQVPPEHRGNGYAKAAMAGIVEWARSEHGATRGYLQVDAGNAAAVGLYERLGWYHHHVYRYWEHYREHYREHDE